MNTDGTIIGDHPNLDEIYDQIEPVLSDEEIAPLEFVDVYISKIENPKSTSALVKYKIEVEVYFEILTCTQISDPEFELAILETP